MEQFFIQLKMECYIHLDSKTGKILWQHKITNGYVNTITPISNKEIITTDFDGKVMMIKTI